MTTLSGNSNYPTPYRIGAGRIRELPDACRAHGIKRPLIVSDPGIVNLPWFAEIQRTLTAPDDLDGAVAHWITHRTFRLFRMLIFLACLVRVPMPAFDVYLVPLTPLWHGEIMLFGCLLLLASFFGIVAINLYMNGHWRSGARPEDMPALITTGPFAVSRNPMMMLILVGQLGFFLALPSVFSLVCLVVGVASILAQSNVEQDEMAKAFGDAYQAYAAQTPKWLFGR